MVVEFVTCPVCRSTQLDTAERVYEGHVRFGLNEDRVNVPRPYVIYRESMRCRNCGRQFVTGESVEIDADLIGARSARVPD